VKENLKKILELSFNYCKHDDDVLAAHFREINTKAHEALKYVERHPDSKEHWTESHYKNYHMN